jgi:two-component system chemotaxis sensor kinase CheA
MEREAELLRLLEAVTEGVLEWRDGSSGEAERAALARHGREAAACAAALEMQRTAGRARDFLALLEREGTTARAALEEQAERLQSEAESELEARFAAAAPAGPGMPWGDFVLETREHLAAVEQELLRLEAAPDDAESVHSLFRRFHTIKGLAAIAGAEAAREVAHQTENLLDEVRNGTRVVSPQLIDLALASADFLGEVAAAAEQLDLGEPVALPDEPTGLLDRLYAAIRSEVMAEAETPGAATRKSPGGTGRAARSAVKVDTGKLDQLVDLVGELVIAQSLVQLDPAVQAISEARTLRNLNQLGRITSELQKTAMALRVVPVGQVFRRMERVFRDLVRDSHKLAVLETAGEDAELDRTIVEHLADPLMHMVRNAVDHGLETPEEREAAGKPVEGTVRLAAMHQSGQVVIEVSDDGRGMNAERILRKARERGLAGEQAPATAGEALEYIFAPGFSTSEEVTAVSGRGVGMDVVRREIERLRGRVEVRSEPGRGTTFLLRVPLTLAIIDALVIRHGERRYILPLFTVREILKPGSAAIYTVEGRREITVVRDRVVPVTRLESMLGVIGAPARPAGDSVLLVVETGGKRMALAVDEVIGKQEVVIKSLGDWVGRVKGVAGGAILGDGSVGMILDLDGLAGGEPYGIAC